VGSRQAAWVGASAGAIATAVLDQEEVVGALGQVVAQPQRSQPFRG